ncbi:MAG: hypothetical protein ABI273_03245 [Lacunisphaera sp.]
MEKIMARFTKWMESMTAKGIVLGTAGLEVSGKVLRRSGEVIVTDGPDPEATEIVGGYVLITASTWRRRWKLRAVARGWTIAWLWKCGR